MIVSVTGKRKLKKRYDGLDIDWAVLEKQLRSWSYLFARRKQLCINITFNYVEITPAPCPSQRQTRRSTPYRNGSATDLMIQELDGTWILLVNLFPGVVLLFRKMALYILYTAT
ncbi:hypothetical protein PG985_005422 [Apiospora marii]|uniref:uncharacterized protein n=1 Tax=Apiospora marii TaxID=335849 RepID=UPI0031314929